MSGYCTVKDVVSAFPQFQQQTPGSVQDADIQGWIDDCKARIRSAFLTRDFDPDNPPNPPLTTDQKNFLRSLNRNGAVADLMDTLQANVTLQPGEASLGAARRKSFETVLTEITKAMHDALFNVGPLGNLARHQDVSAQFGGTGGAEISPEDTPVELGQNRTFWKDQLF